MAVYKVTSEEARAQIEYIAKVAVDTVDKQSEQNGDNYLHYYLAHNKQRRKQGVLCVAFNAFSKFFKHFLPPREYKNVRFRHG